MLGFTWVTLMLFVPLGCENKHDDLDAAQPAQSDQDADADADDSYSFDSRFVDGESSVSYSGQILRQVLVTEMSAHISDMTNRIDGGWTPIPGEAEDELLFYLEFDSETGGEVELDAVPETSEQRVFDDIAWGKDLVSKLAGNDDATDHADWATDFVGWDHPDVSSPESLIRLWFAEIDAAATARGEGDAPTSSVYLSANGVDHQQLLQKFLLGAVNFSQAADDYLDDDIDGKGLLSGNVEADGDGGTYSSLEHTWDEGFGYFGASRTYGTMDDTTINEIGHDDADGSETIDLTREACWGASINAAKRDLGASEEAPTDFTGDAWVGFHGGREIIANAEGTLSETEMEDLQAHRDMAISAWEGAIAATVVHYINDMLRDLGAFGTDAYDMASYAKHWSEAKGFALGFQFNPRSPLTPEQFSGLHDALGMQPVLPVDGEDAVSIFVEQLLTAREVLGTAYEFDAANLGDDNGENGW